MVALRALVVLAIVAVSLVAPWPTARGVAEAATCVSSTGPGIAAPAAVPNGIPGFHAHWYGQSGYMSLCPGARATATVAFHNSGSFGWVQGRMGEAAYLGTWGVEPGQDQPSVLGGDGTLGSPNTGWPRFDRIAVQPAAYVGPGQVAWFQFAVQAPTAPGTYRLGIRPLIEGASWLEDFGVFWEVTVLNPDGTAPRRTPASPRNVFYDIGPGVLAQDINEIQEGVARVAAFLADTLGWGGFARPITVRIYVGGDEAVCCLADANGFRIAVGHRIWRNPPAAAPDTWSAATERKEIAAHELAHVWAGRTGWRGCLTAPIWIVEGIAESLAYRALLRDGLITPAALDRFQKRWVSSARHVPLSALETTFPNDTNPYNVSWLAVDRGLASVSQQPLVDYCWSVGNGAAWRSAFAAAFNESADAFYTRFETLRAEFVR